MSQPYIDEVEMDYATPHQSTMLPEGWYLTKLGEIAEWGSGGTPSRKNSSFYGGNVPWIKTGDLGAKIIRQSSEFITEEAVAKSSAKLFLKGSVAIAMYGATIGKTSIFGIDATTNQACGVGQPIAQLTTSEFLYYFLRNEKDNFIAKGKGGAQPNISQGLIKEHEVVLPPLAEQQEIAAKLEDLEDLLAQVDIIKTRLDAIPKILKRFRQSVLSTAVSGKLTADWRNNNSEQIYSKGIDVIAQDANAKNELIKKHPELAKKSLLYNQILITLIFLKYLMIGFFRLGEKYLSGLLMGLLDRCLAHMMASGL